MSLTLRSSSADDSFRLRFDATDGAETDGGSGGLAEPLGRDNGANSESTLR